VLLLLFAEGDTDLRQPHADPFKKDALFTSDATIFADDFAIRVAEKPLCSRIPRCHHAISIDGEDGIIGSAIKDEAHHLPSDGGAILKRPTLRSLRRPGHHLSI
jgi:hypothetical protein